jgi:hypothetical protein
VLKVKDLNKDHVLIRILDSDLSNQLKDNIYEITEELLDLISKYKATRNLLEVKLKHNDDPGQPDFYAHIAKLSLFDIIIRDLEHLNTILCQ